LDSEDELSSADLALAAAREQVAYLQGSAELRVVALAALVGRPISDLPPLSLKDLPSFPAILPDNVKIDLMSRRADITASRWRVEAAERSLASARADFFPDVTVNALLGLSSLDVGKLLEYGSRVPQVSAAIHLPIFDAGRLKARYGGAQAAIDAAVSSYQDTVIGAARDVATQATTRAQIEAQRAQRLKQVEAALRMKNTAAARVRQGLSDSRSELLATQSWIDQRDGLIQLDSAALSADIALQRALGGGYVQELARSSSTTATP
jgi:multidrug efflux system outer membrane protein